MWKKFHVAICQSDWRKDNHAFVKPRKAAGGAEAESLFTQLQLSKVKREMCGTQHKLRSLKNKPHSAQLQAQEGWLGAGTCEQTAHEKLQRQLYKPACVF